MKLRTFIALFIALMVGAIFTEGVHAQSAALSKDYWVSYLPSKRNAAPIWLLMCTNVSKTHVKVVYSEDPSQVDEFTIDPGKPQEYRIRIATSDAHLMAKPSIEEVVQQRSVHVIASNPISMQGFTDADNNVGLFLVLPTSSLGQNYVIAAYNDQPAINDPSSTYANFDSSSGGFVVTAVE